MFTVIDKLTGNEIRTHSMFRVGSLLGVQLAENEQLAYIPNDLIEQLESAFECSITVDENGMATAITVTKTLEQWRQENPLPPQPLTEIEQLRLEMAQANTELFEMMLMLNGGVA